MVILVTRGNGPSGNKPEDPGALKIFSYTDGLLMNRASIAPGGGFNFQPRNLDFHPLRPWVFVSLERQNKLQVYEKLKGGTLSHDPVFIKDTAANTDYVRPGQLAGPIHIHPNGRFVYQLVVTARDVANRTRGIAGNQDKSVVGGENFVAVFTIDQNTAEPTLIQNIDTRGLVPRAFDLDPTGRILIVANQLPSMAVGGTNVSTMPPNLAVFRVHGDGKLDFVRTYDVQTDGSKSLFWMGLVPLH
jgi:6-phosphogluconolactonase (cycloisomerase 2 family)